MASESGDSSMPEDCMEIVDLTFGPGFEFQAMHNKPRTMQWFQEEISDISETSKTSKGWKVLFPRSGCQLRVYVARITMRAMIDTVMPRLQEVLGAGGQVKHYTESEVRAMIQRDRSHKNNMAAKTESIGGSFDLVVQCMKQAMDMSGFDAQRPTKRHRIMSGQVADVIHTAQQTKADGVAVKRLRVEGGEDV